MKYLVLRPFRSFGRGFVKGEVVEEELIRSPRLRASEGLIVPAVSSAKVPEEVSVVAETSVLSKEPEDEIDTPIEGVQEDEAEQEPAPKRFSLKPSVE